MATIAYDFGDIIEVVTPDETGAAEQTLELDLDGDRDEILCSAGFERIGEWRTVAGRTQADVEAI